MTSPWQRCARVLLCPVRRRTVRHECVITAAVLLHQVHVRLWSMEELGCGSDVNYHDKFSNRLYLQSESAGLYLQMVRFSPFLYSYQWIILYTNLLTLSRNTSLDLKSSCISVEVDVWETKPGLRWRQVTPLQAGHCLGNRINT